MAWFKLASFFGNSCLSKKLGAAFTGEINICHKDKEYELTVFPEALNKYFGKVDIVKEFFAQPKELEGLILALTDIDMTVSISRKVILSIVDHEEPDDPIL